MQIAMIQDKIVPITELEPVYIDQHADDNFIEALLIYEPGSLC